LRSSVKIRSESTKALGQPRLIKPTFGDDLSADSDVLSVEIVTGMMGSQYMYVGRLYLTVFSTKIATLLSAKIKN
jgi:hypothetical protein